MLEAQSARPTARVEFAVDVAIIGAGIGGLAAAAALKHAGIDAHVYERASKLEEAGGAIVIREPSVKLFDAWGIGAAFLNDAVRVKLIELHAADGTSTGTMDPDFNHEGRSFTIHRADLHALLRSAVAADHVHLGMTSAGIANEGDRGIIRFADGTVVRAKAVIGADGITSVARKIVSDDELVFENAVVMRGVAPATALPTGLSTDRIHLWGSGERMMNILPMRSGRHVALNAISQSNEAPKDLWTTEISRDVLLDFFSGFSPALLDLIKAGTAPIRANPVYDRDPIDRWSVGRVTLLGDAAHPMAPRMGQGANMAIEDADALAAAFMVCGLDHAVEALHAYEHARLKITSAMQLASRKTPAAAS